MTNRKGNVLKAVVVATTALLCLPVAHGQSDGAPVYSVGDSDIESRLTVLERQVKNRAEMQHRLQQQIDNMQLELDELRGAVEVHTNQLQKVLDRQRELYLEIDKRVEALKETAVVPVGAGGSATVPATNTPTQASTTTATTTPTMSGLSESEAYEKAVNLILKSREYDKAIPEFQAFIARFPDSSYAPNAHYWLGELALLTGDNGLAATEFETVIKDYPASSKVSDAMLFH